MLENYNTQPGKQQQGNQGAAVPRNNYWLTDTWKVSRDIPQVLPEPTNVGGGSTRFTANQIARSNRAGQIGAFGQMATLVLGGKERSVSARCGSTPSRVSLFTAVKSQSPTRVDSTNGTKRYFDGSKDINESDLALTNLNPRIVETRPGKQKAQPNWGQALGKAPKTSFFDACPQCQDHDSQHHPGDYLAKARAKDLHLVNDSLAGGVFA
jgi:hypothetical protein